MTDSPIDSLHQPTPKRLSLKTKLAYGAGDLGTAITTNILVLFLLPFFTRVVGLNPALAGDILALSKIWDAFNDPIVGILADKTHTPWGRRRPWIAIGALPFGLSFVAQWLIPFPGNTPALFGYYILVSVIFNSFYTAVNLPYTALTPELTQDYDERTRLNQYRFAFVVGGSLVSAVLHPLILDLFEADTTGYLVSGSIWSVVAVMSCFWCVWGTFERYQDQEPKSLSISEQLKSMLTNYPYLIVIGIYLFSWLGFQFTASIFEFYVRDWMGLSGAWLSGVLAAVQGTSFLMLPVWSQISARLGKRAAFGWGVSTLIVALLGLLVLQPGQTTGLIGLGILAGIGVSTVYLIPWSMIPDVIEIDELATGQRREGIFYSAMIFVQKLGLAGGLSLVGRILAWSGFQATVPGLPAPVQPDSALLAIRLAISVAPAVVLLISLGLTYLYPITRAKHAEIVQQLAQQRRRQPKPNVPD